jgi:hypothetical protein
VSSASTARVFDGVVVSDASHRHRDRQRAVVVSNDLHGAPYPPVTTPSSRSDRARPVGSGLRRVDDGTHLTLTEMTAPGSAVNQHLQHV